MIIITDKSEFNRHNGHEYRIISMQKNSPQINLLHISEIKKSKINNNVIIDIPGISLRSLINLRFKFSIKKVFLQDSQTLYFKSKVLFLIKSRNLFSTNFLYSFLKMIIFFLKELSICFLFNKIGFVSNSDASIFKILFNKKILVISNGIDFQSEKSKKINNNSKVMKFIFWGNMSYEPNNDSFIFLLENYWSKLSEDFNIELHIHGHSSLELSNHILNHSNIFLKGKFDNLNDIFCKDSIFLNFVEFGSGIKNKTLEALSNGIPMITAKHSIIGTGIENSYKFSYSNYSELKESIDNIKTADENYIIYLQNFITQNYNWTKSTEEYIAI